MSEHPLRQITTPQGLMARQCSAGAAGAMRTIPVRVTSASANNAPEAGDEVLICAVRPAGDNWRVWSENNFD
jgi:hypothetical protein